MHYSRVSVAPSKTYSAASVVLLVELLKGTISLFIALSRIVDTLPPGSSASDHHRTPLSHGASSPGRPKPAPASRLLRLSGIHRSAIFRRLGILRREVISQDCWKLSIPAILYVIQNNLQFVAASNLDVATFQVTYQMKILTTAAFSVLMLRKRLTARKWVALLCLATGVAIVQIQSRDSLRPSLVKQATSSTIAAAEVAMNPFIGFMAVSAACMTSGLAGVYFEMVLKGSKVDLWIRNLQLTLFSLLPAVTPVLFNGDMGLQSFFRNFGFWTWCTVLVQVLGGIMTAVVIKYSDNIMKGFATSLSIVISFLASVALFDFQITPSFVIGAGTVLGATAAYNSPDKMGGEADTGLANGPAAVAGKTPILGHASDGDTRKYSISSLKNTVTSLTSSTTSPVVPTFDNLPSPDGPNSSSSYAIYPTRWADRNIHLSLPPRAAPSELSFHNNGHLPAYSPSITPTSPMFFGGVAGFPGPSPDSSRAPSSNPGGGSVPPSPASLSYPPSDANSTSVPVDYDERVGRTHERTNGSGSRMS